MTMMLMKTLMMLSLSSPKSALPACLANANTANEYFYKLIKIKKSILFILSMCSAIQFE